MTTWSINGKSPENSFIFRSGLKMQVTPEGDCREATFMAKGAGLGLRPLDIVEISCDGQRLFAGELRVGGNTRDVTGHQYTVRSLALRLKEVVIPDGWSAPQQSASATVRSLIESVLPQLGGAFSIGTIALPFDCRAIKNANQQNPYALLEQIAQDGAAMGIDVRFGVNAQRQFFCQPKSTGGMGMPSELTAATRWDAPVAETPCTAVLWYVARKSDGSWLTHMSQAPEAGQYGVRVKPVSLTSDVGIWRTAAHTLTVEQAPPLSAEEEGRLMDADQTSGVTVSPTSGQAARVILTLNEPALRIGLNLSWQRNENLSPGSLKIEIPGSMVAQLPSIAIPSDPQTDPTLINTVEGGGAPLPAGTTLTMEGKPDKKLKLFTFRPITPDTALLDRLARFHYNIPHEAAGDIEVRGLYPIGAGQIDGVPIAAYEYRISADRGVCTGILLGQADDPNKLAQAELIKARDNQATINALISKE